MKAPSVSDGTVTEYHLQFSEKIQARLNALRSLVFELLPTAKESISYGMPTFKQNKALCHYAAYANHIGFYPTPSAIIAFEKRLGEYKFSKGAIQFPHDRDFPMDLISEIIQFRIKEDSKELNQKTK